LLDVVKCKFDLVDSQRSADSSDLARDVWRAISSPSLSMAARRSCKIEPG
jgi:hypothetical protein